MIHPVITVSQNIREGTHFKAKKQIIVERFPPGSASEDYFVFLEEGESGIVQDIRLYRFEQDGNATYYANFCLCSQRSSDSISFSTKPCRYILPNFEDDYEILE